MVTVVLAMSTHERFAIYDRSSSGKREAVRAATGRISRGGGGSAAARDVASALYVYSCAARSGCVAEAERAAATIVAPNGIYGNKPSPTHCPTFYASNADGWWRAHDRCAARVRARVLTARREGAVLRGYALRNVLRCGGRAHVGDVAFARSDCRQELLAMIAVAQAKDESIGDCLDQLVEGAARGVADSARRGCVAPRPRRHAQQCRPHPAQHRAPAAHVLAARGMYNVDFKERFHDDERAYLGDQLFSKKANARRARDCAVARRVSERVGGAWRGECAGGVVRQLRGAAEEGGPRRGVQDPRVGGVHGRRGYHRRLDRAPPSSRF